MSTNKEMADQGITAEEYERAIAAQVGEPANRPMQSQFALF